MSATCTSKSITFTIDCIISLIWCCSCLGCVSDLYFQVEHLHNRLRHLNALVLFLPQVCQRLVLPSRSPSQYIVSSHCSGAVLASGVSATCTSKPIVFATGARAASRRWLGSRRSEQWEKVMQETAILSITFTP